VDFRLCWSDELGQASQLSSRDHVYCAMTMELIIHEVLYVYMRLHAIDSYGRSHMRSAYIARFTDLSQYICICMIELAHTVHI
jgi:hypothetical protein